MAAKELPDDSPATPAEFKHRFADYLPDLLEGRDAAKVRLVIEEADHLWIEATPCAKSNCYPEG